MKKVPTLSLELLTRIVALRRGNGLIIATGKMSCLVVTLLRRDQAQLTTLIGLS